jgi:hypothetical protein
VADEVSGEQRLEGVNEKVAAQEAEDKRQI